MFVIAIVFELALLVFIGKQYGLIGEPVPIGEKVAVVDFNQPVTQKFVNDVIKSMDKVKENKDYASTVHHELSWWFTYCV